jgi:hypothetical protein
MQKNLIGIFEKLEIRFLGPASYKVVGTKYFSVLPFVCKDPTSTLFYFTSIPYSFCFPNSKAKTSGLGQIKLMNVNELAN